jgi:hypothetical protein
MGGRSKPEEWYEILNRKVFFWVNEKRLGAMLRAYGGREQVILTIDTYRLLSRPSLAVTLSPINSGNTRRKPVLRGRDTFYRLQDYPFDELRIRRHGVGNAVAELAVDWMVPDIDDLVIRVESWSQ